MGYSISSTDTLSSSLTISRTAWMKWKERDLPECNPLDNLKANDFGAAPTCKNGHEQDGGKPFCAECGEVINDPGDARAPIKRFSWSSVASDSYLRDGTLAEFAADLEGEADILLTWESGDSFSGIRIKDGKASEHEVDMVLGKKIKDL
jgi:hypothetical protein